MSGYGLDRHVSGEVQLVGNCECVNEHSGSKKWENYFDQLQTGQLLKKDCDARSKYYYYYYYYYDYT